MASPMQDAAVSSSGSGVRSPGLDTSENEDLTCNTTVQKVSFYKVAPCQVKTMQLNGNCCSWMTEFNNDMCRLAHCSNFQLFIQSLAVYARNTATDAVIYSLDTSKLAVLRSHISNVLLFYHFHWYGDTKFQRMDDHCSYLQYMSEIMITYVNLELKFSGTSSSSQNELITKILQKLCLHLDCSEEHIFKVLLKSELVTEQYKNICSPIIKKFFLQALSNKEQLTSIMYIRYIITFKLWRSMYKTKMEEKERREIETLAFKLMGYGIPPSCFDAIDFFPKPLERCIDKTLWYLKTSSFDVKTTIKNFLRFEEESYPHQPEPALLTGCRNQYHFKVNDKIKRNQNPHFKSKSKPTASRRINNEEILFVDLTEESVTKNRVKSAQPREIGWLKSFKDNLKNSDSKFLHEKEVMKPSSVSWCTKSEANTLAVCISDEDVNKLLAKSTPASNNLISNISKYNNDPSILHDSYNIFGRGDIYIPTSFYEYNTEDYALPLINTMNWTGKMPNFDDFLEEKCCTMTAHEEYGYGITDCINEFQEDISHHGRKRLCTTLKMEDCSPLKMKKTELFSVENESIAGLEQDIKLEEPCADELPTPFSERHVEPIISQLNLSFCSQKAEPQHQVCDESTNYSRLQALVEWINSNGDKMIITVFDSGDPILQEVMYKKTKPTSSHYFIRLLSDKGYLLRHYTQNNGKLEKLAGVPPEQCVDFSKKDSSSKSCFPLSICDTSGAGLLIFFTNSLSTVSRWLGKQHPRSFIIQEKTAQTENMSLRDFLKLHSTPRDNFKIENDSKNDVIQAETCDKFCSLLVRLLGWSVSFLLS
ncbi:hypothetical protein QAD02_009841 [Eretmocerus hayati]|uniref:Uncharacterized protein n=1 Tax=Eretmocerus hayati TaxID=131215 RepID=A0ACC2NBQ1_9HYME|nr:hypothetical protein QAD02_009841 [Eretmocerus hayati]